MNASLILTNGRIYTLDKNQPMTTAIALAGNRILIVGDDGDMKTLPGPHGKHVDLAGRCVIPGLVDAHVHFQTYAAGMRQLALYDVSGLDEALHRVASENGGLETWLQGRGWNQADWPTSLFPTAADLDRVQSRRPVFLRHKSGHAAWVNSRALQLAGIGADTADPPGGQILRDESGYPTGILLEEAMKLVASQIPEPSILQLADAMRSAQEKCWQYGLTGFHDFDGRSCFSALQYLRANDELKLRVVKNIPVKRLDHAIGLGLRTGFGDEWLRIGGIKIFADGALGPRTAAMIDPYEEEPHNRGIVVTDKEDMLAYAGEASANGLSVTVHAIGDRANHDVLDVLEIVRRQEAMFMKEAVEQPSARLRHRIEHAQIVHPSDFQRFSQLGVIASMQPIHAMSDMEMADRYWGGRTKFSYAWRSMLEAGVTLAFGSDAPVDPIEPMTGIFAAVNRYRPGDQSGKLGWHPEQSLTLQEAIFAYTMGPALACAREATMGSITPGKLADFTILDRDVFTLPSEELSTVKVEGTVINGDFVYRNW